jgi:CRISPR-associated endonuclease Csn1
VLESIHHYETSSTVEKSKELRDTGYKVIKSLPYFEGIFKVRINHIGHIISVGDE